MYLRQIFENQTLNEVSWSDRSPLVQVLEKNRGRWIHFSSIPKLGVNPRKSHKDPHGIYFYPVDWILSRPKRVEDGDQYGFDNQFYFIVDLDLNGSGLVLSQTTWDDVRGLAERNGWKDYLEKHTPELPRYAKKDVPGSFLWHFLDNLNRGNHVGWNKAFRGVDYIYDDDNSIIHSNEPHQILVLNPRIIQRVDMGEQRKKVGNRARAADATGFELYGHAVLTILKRVQAEYGGKIKWQAFKDSTPYVKGKKMRAPTLPVLDFFIEDLHIQVAGRNQRSWGTTIYLGYQFGREKHGFTIVKPEEMDKLTVEEIVRRIGDKADELAMLEADLRFEPFISEGEAKSYLASISKGITNFDVEINNDYEQVILDGKRQFNIKGTNVTTKLHMTVFKDKFHVSAYIVGPNQPILYVTGASNTYFTTPEEATNALVERFIKGVETTKGSIGADGYGYPRFYADEWDAYVGWLVLNCGLDLHGRLRDHYEAEIARYISYSDVDKTYLVEKIARVLGRDR